MKPVSFGAAVCVALCFATASGAQEQRPTRRPSLPLAGIVTNPDWVAKPNGDDMGRVYPKIAMFMGLEGRTMIKCRVNASGAVEACQVLSEQPVGIGFGQAAIQLSGMFRMKPQTVDGVPVGGAEVSIPITFRTAEEEPLPANPQPAPSEKVMALARRLVVAVGYDKALDQMSAVSMPQLKASEYAASSGAAASGQEPALEAIADSFKGARTIFVDEVARTYAQVFTEPQLTELVTYFENPAAKLWVSKMEEVNRQLQSSGMAGRVQREVTEDAHRRFCQKIACFSPAAPPAQGAKP